MEGGWLKSWEQNKKQIRDSEKWVMYFQQIIQIDLGVVSIIKISMDQKKLKRQYERNKKAQKSLQKKVEDLCIDKQDKFNLKNPQIDPNDFSEYIRILINKYLGPESAQSDHIISYLIRVIGELSDDQQYRERCLEYTKLNRSLQFNIVEEGNLSANKVEEGNLSANNAEERSNEIYVIKASIKQQLINSIQSLSSATQQQLNQIEAISRQIDENENKIAQFQQQIQNYKEFLKNNSDVHQTKEKMKRQLQHLIQERSKQIPPREQIRGEFEAIENEFDKVYGEIEEIPKKEEKEEIELRKSKEEEKRKKEEKIIVKRKRAKLESQIKRLELLIQKKKNLLNVGLSEISDIYPNSKLYDKDIVSEPESPEPTEWELMKAQRNEKSKRIYSYQKPQKNTFCDLLLIIFGLILAITFFMKKSNQVIPEEI